MTCETQYFRFVPHTTFWMTSKYTEIKNTSDMDHFKDIVMLLLYIKLERVTWTFLSDLKEGIVQCNKVQGSRKEDEEVRGDEPQTCV